MTPSAIRSLIREGFISPMKLVTAKDGAAWGLYEEGATAVERKSGESSLVSLLLALALIGAERLEREEASEDGGAA